MKPHADARLIQMLGGPSKVASILGYRRKGGIQRVHNWMKRGIPARVRLENPDLFPFKRSLSVAL